MSPCPFPTTITIIPRAPDYFIIIENNINNVGNCDVGGDVVSDKLIISMVIRFM